jgi:hypothetical protein
MVNTATASDVVKSRYRDAYFVGLSLVRWGQGVEVLGIVAGVTIALLGLVGAMNASTPVSPRAVLVPIILAAAIVVASYIAGIMVAAQGQIVLAVLDTAVNTSPLLSQEEKAEVITALRGPVSGSVPSVEPSPDVTGEGAPPTIKCPSCGATVYATAKVCLSCWKPLS